MREGVEVKWEEGKKINKIFVKGRFLPKGKKTFQRTTEGRVEGALRERK
jgi:hypothetical protein